MSGEKPGVWRDQWEAVGCVAWIVAYLLALAIIVVLILKVL